MTFGVISSPSRLRVQQEFLSQILAITGDTRLLWLPAVGDTTTSTDQSLNARVITYNATIAAQFATLGLGQSVSFDGSTDYGTTPDVAGLTFGDAATDTPFSVLGLANVTDSAASRTFVSKYNNGASQREWTFGIGATDLLTLILYDESVDVSPSRAADGAITAGAWALYGGVYTAATVGATAADDIVLYTNGVLTASTATNNVSYVAMENTTAVGGIGTRGASAVSSLLGSMALTAVVAKALSASEMWAIYQLCKWYYAL